MSPRKSWNAFGDVDKPYNAFAISIMLPSFAPNSGPAQVQTFSTQGAVMNALSISPVMMERPCWIATSRSSRTVKLATVEEYVV